LWGAMSAHPALHLLTIRFTHLHWNGVS
jgi:hypothetical protein